MKPGTRLGSYKIVAALGVGGMGEVFRATDTRLGRDVAIKVLPVDVAADANRLARFEQEARTVASLNHPNIVTLFSVEDVDDVRFITMELVEGQSLEGQIIPGGLPFEKVLELGIVMVDALAVAHKNGIVHRDLKPANVMLTNEGQIKILDFGLAKLATPEPGSDIDQDMTIATPLSNEGAVMGTVPYMAPEQLRGEVVDHRTDIFALGILLFELATGRRPFEGKTMGVISTAILRDEPLVLTDVRKEAPVDLERIITRCLEKNPQARFQTAQELTDELKGVGQAPKPETILKSPPKPPTPLLGREKLLVTAINQVSEGARLLTVTGYGGTGKTRFSIELFQRLAPQYDGGAAFISLASVTDATEVMTTVSGTLDIPEAHGRSAFEALCTVISNNRMLLVLDNLEQVLNAAEDIAALVSRCPSLQIIATSRAPLKVGAESEFVLPPLDLPGLETQSPETLKNCPSVLLFTQRATKVKTNFVLDTSNAEAVAAICRQLDGLPLALELAAARVRILDPAVLLKRLDRALDLLTSGDRDLPLRQRTLRATISWSYSLLEGPEQELLRRVSVFHDGWTLEAMEQVCYSEEEQYRALDELESLVEKGLVRLVGNSDRFALLETIRAFSAEQLHAGGEVEQVRNRHADYYVKFTGQKAREFQGIGQVKAVRLVRADNSNELAAIQWLMGQAHSGDFEALEKGLLLCGQLDWFWHVGGLHNTARILLDDLLELATDRPPSRGRALSSLAAGLVSTTTGEWDRSLAEWTRGYADGSALSDDEIKAEGAMGMSYIHLNCGRLEEAWGPTEEAIAISSHGVSEFMFSLSLSLKGMLLFQKGELDQGMQVVEDAIKIQKRLKDCEGGGIALSFLAQMHFSKGNMSRSRELYDESLTNFVEVGDRPEVARVYCEMGWTALAEPHAPRARKAFLLAVQVYEEVGSPRGAGLALLGLAAVEAAEGKTERAVSIAAAAQALTERAGVVCDHPMDPGVMERIDALKVTIPQGTLQGLESNAKTLSPAEVLEMFE